MTSMTSAAATRFGRTFVPFLRDSWASDQSAGVLGPEIGYGNDANMGWRSWVRRSRWSAPRS